MIILTINHKLKIISKQIHYQNSIIKIQMVTEMLMGVWIVRIKIKVLVKWNQFLNLVLDDRKVIRVH